MSRSLSQSRFPTEFHGPALTFRKPSRHPMRRLMSSATIALMVLALMIAASLPARADSRSDQMARTLISAIAVGALIHGVNNTGKRRAEPVHVSRPSVIPARCAIEIHGSRRSATVYPERCLRREGVRSRLPQQCGFEATIYGRKDRVYGAECLRDAGFRVPVLRNSDRGYRDHGYGHGRDKDRGYGPDRDDRRRGPHRGY
ncbi:hypothetical protein ACSBLW_12330 [Thioclava sp. FR2]|uniref:hypothetical protein n=1 Tax=Thioclava sp. FR2 TaxID=3445780 RepID=UPI003EB78272